MGCDGMGRAGGNGMGQRDGPGWDELGSGWDGMDIGAGEARAQGCLRGDSNRCFFSLGWMDGLGCRDVASTLLLLPSPHRHHCRDVVMRCIAVLCRMLAVGFLGTPTTFAAAATAAATGKGQGRSLSHPRPPPAASPPIFRSRVGGFALSRRQGSKTARWLRRVQGRGLASVTAHPTLPPPRPVLLLSERVSEVLLLREQGSKTAWPGPYVVPNYAYVDDGRLVGATLGVERWRRLECFGGEQGRERGHGGGVVAES